MKALAYTTTPSEPEIEVACPKCGCEFAAPIPASVAATRLSRERRAARAHFNKMFHAHLESEALKGNTLVPAWANTLAVSEEYVRAQGRITQITSVLAAGDLDALDPVDLVPFLERWLERTRARIAPVPPTRDVAGVVLTHMTNAGDLAGEVRSAMAHTSEGGEAMTTRELRKIEANLDRIEQHARIAKLGVRAAAEAAEREGL